MRGNPVNQTVIASAVRRAALRLALAAGLAAAVAACGSQPDGPKRPVVARIMKSLANEAFVTMEDGARAHQQQHASDCELVATGIEDGQDVARQIEIVEQMIHWRSRTRAAPGVRAWPG